MRAEKATSSLTQPPAVAIFMAVIALLYLAATLPYLGDFPMLDWPQMGIAAPAYKLASQGVYGNDLFTGFYRTELRNYEYMPAYPLLVASSFKVLGLGVWQARIVSVCCGLLTIFLTFHLGRKLYGPTVGLVAAAILCILSVGAQPGTSGIPLLDFARIIRYDIAVPVFTLTASICFVRALGVMPADTPGRMETSRWLFGAGIFAGFATLSHVYGAFILTVFCLVLVWQHGLRLIRHPSIYLMLFGWILAMLPWLVYVLQDLEAFTGQMLRHEGRFNLLDIGFYWSNLLREPYRYAAWIGGFPEGLLKPRIGIWLLLAGLFGGALHLLRRVRTQHDPRDRFLLLALPTLALSLALLINLKRNVYTVLLLPFMALQVALFVVAAWRYAARYWRAPARFLLAVPIFLALLEGGIGIANAYHSARNTTPYREVTDPMAAIIPSGSKLLISQPYWLGLADFDTRSLNLLFEPIRPPEIPVDSAIELIDPDYIVVERYFVDRSVPDTRPSSNPAVVQQWMALSRYLEQYCPRVFAIPDQSYGTVDVYACENETPS